MNVNMPSRWHRYGLLVFLSAYLFCASAYASSDFGCEPKWSLLRSALDLCNNLAFLSPANDSRVNLRLLLADTQDLPLSEPPISETELQEGYGSVPFDLSRIGIPSNFTPEPEQPPTLKSPVTMQLKPFAEALGIDPNAAVFRNQGFLDGEGSRCRSNNAANAVSYITEVQKSAALTTRERQALAFGRVELLTAEGCQEKKPAKLNPFKVESPLALQFADYLFGARDFYNGSFSEAQQKFEALQASQNDWLKETASYLIGRNQLNAAQQNAFDEWGFPNLQNVDKAMLQQSKSAFETYIKNYPDGLYTKSAQGLLRRVAWLESNWPELAESYVRRYSDGSSARSAKSINDLIQEIDQKLFNNAKPKDLQDPLLLAVADLMRMRSQDDSGSSPLTWDDLEAQRSVFAKDPELFSYLQSAYRLFVDNDPDSVLNLLADADPAGPMTYQAFSRLSLRALAFETKKDWIAAELIWLQTIPLSRQAFQQSQLQLAIALNYERSDRLDKVFGKDSVIRIPQIRYILLRHVAGADLLRRQIEQAEAIEERETALFVLLYKDLMRGRYADFGKDLAWLNDRPKETRLGQSIGYLWGDGLSFALFSWNGEAAESGYVCPNIRESAATLRNDPQNPHGLICLGEFVLRNQLDGMPLDNQPEEDELGGSPRAFEGTVFSRMDAYRQVIANANAAKNDRAYALYRAIKCFAPSGSNSCGNQDIALSERKQWFRELKARYADSNWANALKYYW